MSNMYTQGLYIDGVYFDIPMISVDEEGSTLDKDAYRLDDGDLHREVIGVYFHYTFNCGVMDMETQKSFWDKINEPVPWHEITVPSDTGSRTFTGYISSRKRRMQKIFSDHVEYCNYSFKIQPKGPDRKPV